MIQAPISLRLPQTSRTTQAEIHAPRLMRWLFYSYLISSPFFGFSIMNINGRGLARVDWLFAVLIISFFFLGFISRRYRFKRSYVNGFVITFLYTGLLGVIFLFDPNASESQLIDFGTKAAQLLLSIAFFFVVSSLSMSENDLRSSLRVWILVAFTVSLFAVYQVFARYLGWPLAYLELTNPSVTAGGGEPRVIYGFTQVSSVFREPSYLGAYLLGPIIILGVFLLKDSGQLILGRASIFNWIVFLTLFLALLLTSSQATYLSLLITIGSMYALKELKHTRITKLILALLIFLILGGVILTLFGINFFGVLSLRFKYLIINMMNPTETAEISSFRIRSECTLAALEVWLSHPFLGVGLNSLSFHTDRCAYSLGWSQLLADQGILGTASLVMVFLTLIRSLARTSRSTSLTAFWSIISTSLILVMVSEIVNGVFTYNWVDIQRWFILSFANLVWIRARAYEASADSEKTAQMNPSYETTPATNRLCVS